MENRLASASPLARVFVPWQGLFALFAGLFALAKVFTNKKANVRRGASAVNCPASFGKYVPIDGRKYAGKFYSQNRCTTVPLPCHRPLRCIVARCPSPANIRSKSEKWKASGGCRLFTEIFPTIICLGPPPKSPGIRGEGSWTENQSAGNKYCCLAVARSFPLEINWERWAIVIATELKRNCNVTSSRGTRQLHFLLASWFRCQCSILVEHEWFTIVSSFIARWDK